MKTTKNTRSRWLAFWMLLLFALGSCKPAPAQIVLRIETDIPQGMMGTLRAIRVELKQPGTATPFYENTFALDGTGGNFRLPGDVAVTLSTDRLGTILDTRVYAMRGLNFETDVLFNVRAVATFPKEDAVTLWVYLANRCLLAENQMCPQGYTCGRYGCEQEVRGPLGSARNDAGPPDIVTVPPIDGGATMDAAGMDAAAMDAARTDAAGMDAADSGCAAGRTMCGATCVDRMTDVNHCGACGNSCGSLQHVVSPSCNAGVCRFACEPGYADCDGNATNGCETPTTTTLNCGACNAACGAGMVCNASLATPRCESNCGSLSMCSGTCVDSQTSAAHCGRCGNACVDAPNSSPICAMGACSITCAMGWGNCDGNLANGCETNTAGDVMNCGSCRSACPTRPNASPTCTSGACGFTCLSGFADCDGNRANGCEADLGSATNCGRCGMVCSGATPICDSGDGGGGGTCTSTCGPPSMLCGTACVDTTSDLAHCGVCNRPCTARTNASVACTSGTCELTCHSSWGNCDGNEGNGCETNTNTSVLHCGACGNACSAGDHAVATCNAGACDVACASGWRDADGDTSNGCEAWECTGRDSICMRPIPTSPCTEGVVVCMAPNMPTCVPRNLPDMTTCVVPATMAAGQCNAGTCVPISTFDGGSTGMDGSALGDCPDSPAPCAPLGNVCYVGYLVCNLGASFCMSVGPATDSRPCPLPGDSGTGVCNGSGMCVTSMRDASMGP